MAMDKICIVAFLVLACTCSVFAENCTIDDDCTNTLCKTGAHVLCQHPKDVDWVKDGGICTCGDVVCAIDTDCFSDLAPLLECHNSMRHCYHGRCVCDQFPGDHQGPGPIPVG